VIWPVVKKVGNKCEAPVKYRAVIFDLGGTLIPQSTWGEQSDYVAVMADTLGVPRDEFVRVWRETYPERTTGLLGTVDDGIRHICRQIGADAGEDAVSAAAQIPLEITRRWLLSPHPEALLMLSDLKRLKVKTGLLSNWSAHLPLLWGESPLASFIDVPVLSACVGLMKPDPRFFLLAAERLRVAPGDCLYVADGMDGELAAALAVGMTPVMIRHPGADMVNPYREVWGGVVITSLREVMALVFGRQ
jgi:putative hydrolase of the HAD superfamily